MKAKFEDKTKLTKSCMSKDRQYNDQKIKDKFPPIYITLPIA